MFTNQSLHIKVVKVPYISRQFGKADGSKMLKNVNDRFNAVISSLVT